VINQSKTSCTHGRTMQTKNKCVPSCSFAQSGRPILVSLLRFLMLVCPRRGQRANQPLFRTRCSSKTWTVQVTQKTEKQQHAISEMVKQNLFERCGQRTQAQRTSVASFLRSSTVQSSAPMAPIPSEGMNDMMASSIVRTTQ